MASSGESAGGTSPSKCCNRGDGSGDLSVELEAWDFISMTVGRPAMVVAVGQFSPFTERLV